MAKKTFSAIILAAGSGTRYGKKKQFEKLFGLEVWKWSFNTIKPLVDEIVVVGIDFPGGESRLDSVYLGLKKCHGDCVIIHDAARPLILPEQINAIKKLLLAGEKSISFYLPSVEAVIYKNEYLDHKEIKRLVSPQACDRKLALEAYEKNCIEDPRDNLQMIQKAFKLDPKLIEGGENLYKLVYPSDLPILEFIAKKYQITSHSGIPAFSD